jgi:hypothetical protein
MGMVRTGDGLLANQIEQIRSSTASISTPPLRPLFLCVSKVFCLGFWYSRVECHTSV